MILNPWGGGIQADNVQGVATLNGALSDSTYQDVAGELRLSGALTDLLESIMPSGVANQWPANASRTWLAAWWDGVIEDTLIVENNRTTLTQEGTALLQVRFSTGSTDVYRELRIYGIMEYTRSGFNKTPAAGTLFTATTMQDSGVNFSTVCAGTTSAVGKWLVANGKKMLVTSLTTTTTANDTCNGAAWIGGTPVAASAYTVCSDAFPRYTYRVYDSAITPVLIGQTRALTASRVNTTPIFLDFQWQASTVAGSNIIDLYIDGSNANCLGDSGTANAAVTTTDTTLVDTREAWAADEWAGLTVACNGKTATVLYNTATTLTFSAWSGGGNPGNGFAWTLAAAGGATPALSGATGGATANPATYVASVNVMTYKRVSKGVYGGHGSAATVGYLYDNLTQTGFDTYPKYSGAVPAHGAGSTRPCIGYRQPLVGGTPKYDQWTKSTGTDAAALVDESPLVDTTDYVSETTVNNKQAIPFTTLRNMSVPAYSWDSFFCVHAIGSMQVSAAGNQTKVSFGNGSADDTGRTCSNAVAAQPLVWSAILDPSGNALTLTTIEAMQTIYELIASSGANVVSCVGQLIVFTQGVARSLPIPNRNIQRHLAAR